MVLSWQTVSMNYITAYLSVPFSLHGYACFACSRVAVPCVVSGIRDGWFGAAQLSPECRDLLSRIFHIAEADRITVQQIMQHPWCAGVLVRDHADMRLQPTPQPFLGHPPHSMRQCQQVKPMWVLTAKQE